MADSHETEPRFVVPLPGGRIARVPFSVLEQYADSNARSVHFQQKRALGSAPGGSKPINTTQITAGESMITINIYAASGEVAIDREETTTQQVVINHSADAADDDDVVAHSLAVDAATGVSDWHTDWEFGECEYTDESGFAQRIQAWHRHPFGTEYGELYEG